MPIGDNDIRAMYDARIAAIEARIERLDTMQDTRYEKLLSLIQEVKDGIAKKDSDKLQIILSSSLSFVVGILSMLALYALHIIH